MGADRHSPEHVASLAAMLMAGRNLEAHVAKDCVAMAHALLDEAHRLWDEAGAASEPRVEAEPAAPADQADKSDKT